MKRQIEYMKNRETIDRGAVKRNAKTCERKRKDPKRQRDEAHGGREQYRHKELERRRKKGENLWPWGGGISRGGEKPVPENVVKLPAHCHPHQSAGRRGGSDKSVGGFVCVCHRIVVPAHYSSEIFRQYNTQHKLWREMEELQRVRHLTFKLTGMFKKLRLFLQYGAMSVLKLCNSHFSARIRSWTVKEHFFMFHFVDLDPNFE